MLVKDSAKVAEHQFRGLVEAERAKRQAWVLHQLKDGAVIGNADSDPTNFESRLGKVLPDWQVEAKLRQLEPNLIFEEVPAPGGGRSTKKKMFVLRGDKKELLMLYEKGMIPERSWMQAVMKESLDPAILSPDKPFHLDRKDLTKHEIIPAQFAPDGSLLAAPDVQFDDTVPMAGMIRRKMPYNEKIRGWRTMLAILVSAQVLTPHQAETHFGADNTPEWAAKMGRAPITRPW